MSYLLTSSWENAFGIFFKKPRVREDINSWLIARSFLMPGFPVRFWEFSLRKLCFLQTFFFFFSGKSSQKTSSSSCLGLYVFPCIILLWEAPMGWVSLSLHSGVCGAVPDYLPFISPVSCPCWGTAAGILHNFSFPASWNSCHNTQNGKKKKKSYNVQCPGYVCYVQ